MKICIFVENAHRIQESIDALDRYLNNKELSTDFQNLVDTKYILIGLQEAYKDQSPQKDDKQPAENS